MTMKREEGKTVKGEERKIISEKYEENGCEEGKKNRHRVEKGRK